MSIQKLDLSNNPHEAKQLSEVIQTKLNPGQYSVVSFRNTGMTNEAAEQLAGVLSQGNWEIGLLDIGCNSLFHGSLTSLSKCLMTPMVCTIVHLHLSNNHVGDEGAVSLAAAIKETKSLSSVRLEQNAISDAGVEAIAEAMTSNESITELCLDGNLMTDAGAINLANMLAGLGMNPKKEPWEEVEAEDDDALTGKGGKAAAKGKGKEKKTEEELAKEEAEAQEKAAAVEEAKERKRYSMLKNTKLVYLSVENNNIDIDGFHALAQGSMGHSELLTLKTDGNLGSINSSSDTRKKERQAATKAVDDAMKYNNNLRVGIVKTAFLFGFHPRVGCRSTIRSSLLTSDAIELFPTPEESSSAKYPFDVSVLDPVWEFLGPC